VTTAAASGRKGKGATGQPRGRTTTAEARAFAALAPQ
jgi:hypothetical protein